MSPVVLFQGLYYNSEVCICMQLYPKRVGYNIFTSLISGGFKGNIYPIHPHLHTVLGHRVYPSLAALPEPVNLVIIALNERATIAAIRSVGAGSGGGCVHRRRETGLSNKV